MLKFITTFIKYYFFPLLKEAAARAVVNQIEDSVYGPGNNVRRMPRRYGSSYGPGYGPRSTRLPRN